MKSTDGRTRAGQDDLVLDQVGKHGGFSIFWATENTRRAESIMRLQEAGKIVKATPAPYPWCAYKLGSTNHE